MILYAICVVYMHYVRSVVVWHTFSHSPESILVSGVAVVKGKNHCTGGDGKQFGWSAWGGYLRSSEGV
jgi:hypothetical protein